MKKIVSLILALLICTVFAFPAAAQSAGEKPADGKAAGKAQMSLADAREKIDQVIDDRCITTNTMLLIRKVAVWIHHFIDQQIWIIFF